MSVSGEAECEDTDMLSVPDAMAVCGRSAFDIGDNSIRGDLTYGRPRIGERRGDGCTEGRTTEDGQANSSRGIDMGARRETGELGGEGRGTMKLQGGREGGREGWTEGGTEVVSLAPRRIALRPTPILSHCSGGRSGDELCIFSSFLFPPLCLFTPSPVQLYSTQIRTDSPGDGGGGYA